MNLVLDDEFLFENEFQKKLNHTCLFKIREINMQGNGAVLICNSQKYPKEFLHYNYVIRLNRFHYYKHFIKKYLVNDLERVSGLFVFVVDIWSFGYFHWMVEILPRLIAIYPELKERKVILPKSYEAFTFVNEVFELLEIRPFFLETAKTYQFNDVLFPSHFSGTGNFNDEAIKNTRHLFKSKCINAEAKSNKRLYISRSKAERRRLFNEEDLTEILNYFNFERVFTEDLSITEQIILFSQANILLSNHGAGLTNMLFMEAYGNVIELRSRKDAVNNCYFSLASALNLNYFYLLCDPTDSSESFHIADLTFDKIELKYLIQSVIDRKVQLS